MALIKATLKNEIKSIFQEMREKEENADDELAARLATAIDNYIKSADIPAGIPVATAGSPSAQTGATTAIAKLL